jgi:cytoskeletal protein CcmA (bactofilin family)
MLFCMTNEEKKKGEARVVTFSETTRLDGLLKFKGTTMRIKGAFHGTIEAQGALIVEKGAVVDADHIAVTSLTVYGRASGMVRATDKIDLFPGSEMRGDLTMARFRIADGVLFEGQCAMIGADREVEIFSRSTEEIKADLQEQLPSSRSG